MTRSFQIVDVFHDRPMSGNPLAVVFGAQGLGGEEMQAITRWLNYSETSFLLPPTRPEADYRVRIFTLDRELPFAGHPTLGSCHAWLSAGGKSRAGDRSAAGGDSRSGSDTVVQECGAGLIAIRRREDQLAFAAPPLLRSGAVDEAVLREVAEVLGIGRSAIVDAAWADNGPGWVAVMLESAAAVLAIEPARSHSRRMDIGVVGAYPPGAPQAFELRAIFSDPHGALLEDPVTGSLNASVAQWLYASGRAKGPYVASQGTRLGRSGRIHIGRDADGTVWVGGRTTTLVKGDFSA